MGVKKTLCMTIICMASLILLSACGSSDDDEKSSSSATSTSSRSLNCSPINNKYDWTETETVEVTKIEDGEQVTEEITVNKDITFDIGATCGFSAIVIYDQYIPSHGICSYSVTGTLTQQNARTYRGSGSFASGCFGGSFDIILTAEGESITYSLH